LGSWFDFAHNDGTARGKTNALVVSKLCAALALQTEIRLKTIACVT
jgi:hypothetical protein